MRKFFDLRKLRGTGEAEPVSRSFSLCAWLHSSVLLASAVFLTGFRSPYFTKITAEDGLSQNTVFSVCQGRDGLMWMGTMDGLSRYDGYDFRIWRSSAADSTSLCSDIVHHVFTDAAGRLWAGTSEGLSLYDSSSDSFRSWRVGPVTGLAAAEDGAVYVASRGGLDVFGSSGRIRSIRLGTGVLPEAIARDSGSLWIAAAGEGLLRMGIPEGDIRKVPEFSTKCGVSAIYPYGEAVWVATEGEGLWCLEFDGKTCTRAEVFTRRDGLPSDYVRSIGTDDSGRLWVGTYGGLSILEDGVFNSVIADPFLEGALSQNSVRSICRDSQGGMWLGTYFGGVNYYHPLKNHFRAIRRTPGPNSLNDNVVNCMVEDGWGRIWIGTNTGGVNCWDTASGTFRHWSMRTGNGASPEPYDVKALYVDDVAGKVYVGAHAGGLSVIDMTSGVMTRFSSKGTGVSSDIYSILPGPSPSTLWLGTLDGPALFDRRTATFSCPSCLGGGSLHETRSARALLLDSDGRLWAGGADGLYVYSVASDGSLTPVEQTVPEGLYAQSLLEVPGKFIWVGTRDGLWRLDCSDRKWKRFSTADGMPSNIVDGLCTDIYDMVWLSTDKGISRFNPFSSSFRNFTVEDGLSGNQFNPSSSLRRSGGELLLGGVDGITAFSPDLLSDNPYSPSPIVTDFRLTGKYASEDIHPSFNGILLSHDRNSFAISFSVPNYLSGHQNRFAYILDGHDDSWTETSSVRTASWSNLPHGKYVFRLRAANNDGKWCENELALPIVIRPVWYETIPAVIAFTLVLILFVIGSFILLSRSKDREKRIELSEQEKVHQEELQQMKTRFFINISHEMRTPLMLIVNPLSEMISRTGDLWMRRQLRYLDRNARRLLHLVNQLIDYRRAELGVFRLHAGREQVMKIVRENWSNYESFAQKKKIRYRIESSMDDSAVALVDAQYLELILSNLLSNAFKYTESGSIVLTVQNDGETLSLSVADTGIGIPEDRQKDIFERFYQVGRDNVGSGIGLSLVKSLVELHHGSIEVQSSLGKGSTFIVKLPQNVSAYSSEELEETPEGGVLSGRDAAYLLENEDESSSESAAQETATDETGGALLIVEDNQEIAVYLRDSLSDRFEIRLASNGEQALELAREAKPDLVITDLNMPVMDGLKLCSRLKQNVSTSDIPVIVISSSTDAKDQAAAFRAGADDYISKPFSLSLLNAKVRNMLRTRSRIIDSLTRSAEGDSVHIGLSAYDEELLAKATAIVEKNMDNADFSTADFASEMGMSRSNLHLKLKALTGESALDFIRRIRFKEACRLLRDGRYSIAVISDLVGFNSPSYFASCFKRYMGCLPTDWGRDKK